MGGRAGWYAAGRQPYNEGGSSRCASVASSLTRELCRTATQEFPAAANLVVRGYTRSGASWQRRVRVVPVTPLRCTHFGCLASASLDGPDRPVVAGRAALRQRVALLALLAIEHPRPISRDKVLACLWPESGTDEARHLLRDTLYILRTALGDDAVLSTGDDLRLNPDRLSSDLWEFEAAFARDDPEAAVGVYHGPFLSGFHFAGADEFERWAEAQRSGLARRYGQALERLAERETHAGDPLKAVEWWRRLALEDPGNSRVALRYMQALAAVGDRAGAHATCNGAHPAPANRARGTSRR